MDYEAETLRQYFWECNYTKEEINELLETNPFGYEYILWEKQKIRDFRYFANIIKKEGLLNTNEKVYEICVNPNFMVSSSLCNERTYKLIPQKERYDFSFPNDVTIIMNGLYYNTNVLLEKLKLYNIPFIIGASTLDADYYEKCKRFYRAMSYKFNIDKYEKENKFNQKIILLHSRKTS